MGLESREPHSTERRLRLMDRNELQAATMGEEVVGAGKALAAAPEDPRVLNAMATVMRKQVAAGQRIIVISDRAALVIADLLEQQATPSSTT